MSHLFKSIGATMAMQQLIFGGHFRFLGNCLETKLYSHSYFLPYLFTPNLCVFPTKEWNNRMDLPFPNCCWVQCLFGDILVDYSVWLIFFPGGLYDARMGPYTDRHNIMCATCVQSMDFCPGHLGHIELPLPVCNPLFYSTILRMLKISCMQCHRFRVPEHIKKLYYVQQRLLDCGDIIAAQQGQLNATVKLTHEILCSADETWGLE